MNDTEETGERERDGEREREREEGGSLREGEKAEKHTEFSSARGRGG